MSQLSSTLSTILLFISFIFSGTNCVSQKKGADKYINNDSLAVYSTHPGRPFKYGPAYSKAECEEMRKDVFDPYQIKKNDVVAEIGAASGWMLGAMSVVMDSVTFYIQDIDTNYLNQDQFNKVLKHYSGVRASPQTNKFHFVIGNYTETKLPENTFDKIIISNTFHEIKGYEILVKDISTKLKPGGQLIITERFSNPYRTVYHKGCFIKAYKVSELVVSMEKLGFYLTGTNDPENCFFNFLVFEKDKKKAELFAEKKSKVAKHIIELDKLNDKNISKDTAATFKIARYLKQHLNEINEVYPVTNYILELGDELSDANQYTSAVNVFKVNTILYPDSAEMYDIVAEVMIDAGQYREAAHYSSISLEIKPEIAETYYARAYAYQMDRDLYNAVEDYTEAIRIDSAIDYYYYDLAYALANAGEHESAFINYDKAIKLSPKEEDYYFERGILHHDMGNFEKAIADFSKIISLNPENGEAYKMRAQVKTHNGDEAGSKSDLEKAKSLKKEARQKHKPSRKKKGLVE